MIYTITLNPSIDYVMFTENFNLGGLNRAKTTYKFAGGKGINVSRVLNTHGIQSTALGYVGGFAGQFIETELNQVGIETKFIQVDDDTRINVKLKGDTETEINAPGPQISAANRAALLSQIKNLTSDDLVVLSGSIPSSMDQLIYKEIAEICEQNQISFIVDAEKALLQSVFPYQPELIKPNKVELEEMFGESLNSDDEMIAIAHQLQAQGVKNVMISLGGEGALLITKEAVYKATVPNGKVVNTVGSGDSTVAGFIAGSSQGLDIEMCFRLAVASGTATAFTEDLATKTQIDEIVPQIKIEQIN